MLEVGSGDGRSFEHYPPGVEQLLAVEPDPTARAVAVERARATAVPIEIVDGNAAELPAPDGAFDAAVVSGLLCSVPDPAAALLELRRVLRAWRRASVLEHVRSEHAAFRLLQRSLDRLLDALAGRVRDDARHRGGYRRRRLRDRGARARLPLVVDPDDHVRAIHPRHGATLNEIRLAVGRSSA